ncbi:dienelactone hydrolase family protein [Ramlibacter sp. PS4R-6]|uniref:dienelactone hydrolase family protein n=1 Tax=Ramlibacter sp. PS4R-6 TaxID=3133438 RepID=UPI0030B58578
MGWQSHPFFFLAACVFAAGVHAQAAGPSAAEKVAWDSIVCVPGACNKLAGQGFLFATPGAKHAVLISHGSQGIDSRMYDYVDALQKAGFAALVIDHWTPRGIGVTHEDYAAASLKGGNEFNMAADSLTAAAFLRARGYARVGSVGESQGGGAAIMMQQKFAHAIIERNVRRLYASDFTLKPVDAVVGLYAPCFYRNAKRDAYVGTPLLLVTGEVDDETPSRYCEKHVGWMNARGGNVRIVVMPGEGHSFDAPYARRYSNGPHYAKCDVLVDETGTTELNSGRKAAGEDANAMMATCVSRGYHTGHSGRRFGAFPVWIGFFRDIL